MTLFKAARHGDLEEVKRLLHTNMTDEDKTMALGSAVKRGDCEMIQVLINAGCDPNEFVLEPLIITAIRRGDMKTFQLLVQHGVDLDVVFREDFETPFNASH